MYRYRSVLVGLLAAQLFTGTAPARADEKPDPKAKEAAVAHIKLSGDLDEAPIPADALFGSSAENFKSKLDRIRKAQKDDAIQGLLLELNGLSIGWGKVDELARAVADFRATGKKAYAYIETGEQKDYLVALSCDEIVVPEAGWLMLTGLRMGVTFYKDLFAKVGVKADMLQMGDFKGAAEPYTRSDMSPQLRQQFEKIIDDYYKYGLLAKIVERRPGKHFTEDQVKTLVDEGPYTAKRAVAAGLIDHVAVFDDLGATLKTGLAANEVKIRRNYGKAKSEEIDFSNPFAIFKLLAPPKRASSSKPKIAVIYATGAIVSGKGGETPMGGELCGSDTMIKAIREADHDDTVKAIVLRVDSPGGSALASDLIWTELKRCKKPVVASMSDVAASGGYYISMAAKRIYAEPGTLTGSIGVVGGKLVLGGMYDLVGLKTQVLTRGENASILSSTTPFSDSERKAMTVLMKDVYEQFLDKALQGRKQAGKAMDRVRLDQLAAGRIWTGRQALENGLVDELGTLADAIAGAKQLAGVEKDAPLELLSLPRGRSFLDQLIESRTESRVPRLRLAPLTVVPEFAGPIRDLEALLELRAEPVWVLLPYRLELK